MRQADDLSHLLDGPAADLLARHLLPQHHPRALEKRVHQTQLTAYRRLLIRAVLLNQARRVFDDHWFGEGLQDKEPYYRAAALACLDDAGKVDPLQVAPATELAELTERVTRSPEGLRIDGPDEQIVTDESTLDLGTAVRSDGIRQEVIPVFWTDPVEPFRVMAPAVSGRMVVAVGDQADPRLGWRLEHQPAEYPAQTGLSPSKRVADFAVHGLFRGQRFDHVTRLVVFPRPDQVASHHPLTGLPRVAVRADAELFNKYGNGTGVVAFVLDASGSMGPPRGEPFTDQTRYGLATRALEQVLGDLPAGTIVGLYSFGAAPPDRKEVPAEETIQTVQPLTPWEPSLLNDWMGRIRYPSIVPWSESPIVRTILSAREDLLSLNVPGLKTIIVITDGDDNRFTEDRVKNPQAKDVPTALKEAFQDTEIQLNVIGFRPTDSAEMERMNSQYQVISQFPVPGRFYYADNVAQIVSNIRVHLTPRTVLPDRRRRRTAAAGYFGAARADQPARGQLPLVPDDPPARRLQAHPAGRPENTPASRQHCLESR